MIYLHIIGVTEEVSDKWVKLNHWFLSQIAAHTPHVTEREIGTQKWMQLGWLHGPVNFSCLFLSTEKRLQQLAYGGDSTDVNLHVIQW